MSANAIALYARETAGFDTRLAHALGLLHRAAAEHPGGVVQATSLGAEDMVITDLIARHRLPVAIGTLETGMLHAPTVALIRAIEARYQLDVEVYHPVVESVVHFVGKHGERAMHDSLALRKGCCAIRKLEPLSRMLANRSAWVTGMRREQSAHRGTVEFSASDDQGRTKFNPLADWSWADVWHYIAANDVPYNPLHDQFYPSIGCVPCTRAIAVGEDFRAGRWWWENEDAKECGLHLKPHSSATPVAVVSPRETNGDFVSATANFGAAEVKGSPEPGQSQNAKECGLHLKPHSSATPVAVVSPRETNGGFVSATANFGAAEVKGSPEPGQSQNTKECGLHLKPHSSATPVAVVSPRETNGGFVSATANFGAAEVKGSPEPGQSQNAKDCGLHVPPAQATPASPIGASV